MSGPALAAALLGAFAVGILAGILADSALRRWREARELRREREAWLRMLAAAPPRDVHPGHIVRREAHGVSGEVN